MQIRISTLKIYTPRSYEKQHVRSRSAALAKYPGR
jgi:hypothetical protein